MHQSAKYPNKRLILEGCLNLFQDEMIKADAYMVVYSVVDKSTFSRSEQILNILHDMDLTRTRPIILVANKIDLARSRAVSSQGKDVGC